MLFYIFYFICFTIIIFLLFIAISGGRQPPWWCRNNRNGTNGRSSMSIKHPSDSIRRPTSNSGVWTWLSNRRPSDGPDQLGPPSSSPAENHYTHMDDAYSPVGVVGEALYAELDRESIRSANPSYQNTAYSQCGEVSFSLSQIFTSTFILIKFYFVHRNTILRLMTKIYQWFRRRLVAPIIQTYQ